MERAWQFLEAGQTAKTFTGEHYPTLEVGCTATLADGSMKTGHLLTTVFYLEQGGQTRKVIIRKKLRGQPGDSPADIRYPVRLVFDRQPLQARRRCRISLAGSTNQAAELALVTALPATTAMPIVRRADGRFDGEIAGSACVWAWRDAAGITVAWREAASTSHCGATSKAVEYSALMSGGTRSIGCSEPLKCFKSITITSSHRPRRLRSRTR